jgi:hypothetical protein
VHLVCQPIQRHRGGRHRVADHHPPHRHQVARLGLEDAERQHQAERRHGGHRQRQRDRTQRAGHGACAAAGRGRAEGDHAGEQGGHEPQAVRVEDRLDHVADRSELDERADHGDREVLFEVGAPPEGDRGGDPHQCQRRGDLAKRDVDGGRHSARPS